MGTTPREYITWFKTVEIMVRLTILLTHWRFNVTCNLSAAWDGITEVDLVKTNSDAFSEEILWSSTSSTFMWVVVWARWFIGLWFVAPLIYSTSLSLSCQEIEAPAWRVPRTLTLVDSTLISYGKYMYVYAVRTCDYHYAVHVDVRTVLYRYRSIPTASPNGTIRTIPAKQQFSCSLSYPTYCTRETLI